VLFYFGLPYNGGDDALFIDAKRGAVCSIVLTAHEFFEAPNAIEVLQCVVFIHEKIEGQFEFVDEFEVGFGVVNAHAEDFDVA